MKTLRILLIEFDADHQAKTQDLIERLLPDDIEVVYLKATLMETAFKRIFDRKFRPDIAITHDYVPTHKLRKELGEEYLLHFARGYDEANMLALMLPVVADRDVPIITIDWGPPPLLQRPFIWIGTVIVRAVRKWKKNWADQSSINRVDSQSPNHVDALRGLLTST